MISKVKNVSASLVLVAAIAIAAVIFSNKDNIDAVNSAPYSTENNSSNEDMETDDRRASNFQTHYLLADKLDNLDQHLRKSDLSQGEVAYIRMQVAGMCSQASNYQPEDHVFKEFNTRLSSFCRNFPSEAERWWENITMLDPADPVIHAYKTAHLVYELAGDVSNTEDYKTAISLLDDIVMDPNAGFEKIVAAEALQQVGHVTPTIDALSSSMRWELDKGELVQAQIVAAQIQNCSRFGCSPGSVLNLSICVSLGGCPNGMKLEEAWRLRYGSTVYNAAKEIAERSQVRSR